MSFPLCSFNPICRRASLHPLRVRYYAAAATASASRPSPKATSKSSAEANAEAEKKRKEIEAERRRTDIAQRKDSPFKDPMNTSVALPLLAVKPPVSMSSLKGTPIRSRFHWAWDQAMNKWGNGVTLLAMARNKRLPRIDPMEQPTGLRQTWFGWISQDKPARKWLDGLRRDALDMYEKMNEAIASGDDRLLRALCQNELLEEALRRHRSYGAMAQIQWKLHGEASPTRVLSIREANMPTMDGDTELFLVHALMRFDTMQSLTVIRLPSASKQKQGRRTAATPAASAIPIVHSPPKRVTEYLVLEGRQLRGVEQWKFRSQFYDDPVPYLRKPDAKEKKEQK